MPDIPRLATTIDAERERAQQHADAAKRREQTIKTTGAALMVAVLAQTVILEALGIAALIRGMRRR